MRSTILVLLCLAAAPLSAQSKKFSSLGDIDNHFDAAAEAAMKKLSADRLAALDAFIGDKANAASTDLPAARMQAAEIALELEKYDAAKRHADVLAGDSDAERASQGKMIQLHVAARSGAKAAELAEAHKKFLADVSDEGVKAAYDVTGVVADALADQDDIAAAKEAWKALGAKFEQVRGIPQAVERAMGDLALIGTDPKAFPEGTKDMQGNPISIDKYKGKVVLLDFWATWCGPCVAELPNVTAAYKKLNSKGFEIIGISLDKEDKTVLDKFLAGHPGMQWPQVYDGKFWKADLAVLYDVKGIPATFLIDQDGKIYRTNLRGKALERSVEKLLAKRTGGAKKS
jgi:thiol-disulfide isomerase/thioredoxin